MTLPAFATQTITVLRATTITDHGNTVESWTSPASHTVTGCSVQPARGDENRTNRDAITTDLIVYAPATADVLDDDRVLYGGVTYDIDGPVQRWQTGVLDHIKIPLRRTEG